MNSAPVLSPSGVVLGLLSEGQSEPTPFLVSEVLWGSTDADGDPLGIAITALDTPYGTLQYSTDQGATWETVRADLINSSTNELALLLGPAVWLRMLPFGDLGGNLPNTVSFRAWDGTSGAQGQYAVIEATGGATPYSLTAKAGLSIFVDLENDAPTFATGTGIAAIAVGGWDDGRSAVVQPDGKILVAGTVDNDFAVMRLNADGSLDMGFNGTGKVTVPVGGSHDTAYSITVQPDDKILVAGSAGIGSNSDFGVVRLNADGSLDAGFNGTGKVIIPVGSFGETAYSITVQPDGKILVAGHAVNDFAVVRLNADGSLDTGFNGTGKFTMAVGGANTGYSITVQPDGKILLAGRALHEGSNHFAVVRLNVDGSLDTDFNGTGQVTVSVSGGNDIAYSITAQPDGKILLAGSTISDFAVVRLNADGSLDTGFNGSGKVVIPVGAGTDSGHSMTVQPDGKIVVAGFAFSGGNQDFAVVRLNADGSLDTSFNGTGKVTIPVSVSHDVAYSVTMQPDGKIVVAGRAHLGGAFDFAVVRLNADGSLDPTFNSVPGSTLGGWVMYTEGSGPVALDTSVEIHDVELASVNDYAGASVTLARRGGANADDLFFGLGPLSFSGGHALLSGVNIGTVMEGDGTLVITFNPNATQARVNQALSSLGYANRSDAPPASVTIDWSFNDGNSGAQGYGSAPPATGSTTVQITATNDLPTGTVTISGMLQQGGTLTANPSLADADGLGAFGYQWYADDVAIDGANGQSYTLSAAEVGKRIGVVVSYTDGGGTVESMTGTAGARVGMSLTGGPGRDRLTGTPGDDIIDGAGADDVMIGGDGDDFFVADHAGDVVTELAGGGTDTVIATTSYRLSAYVENLVLAGTLPLSAWGNAQANLLMGNAAANVLSGQGGADTYTGGLGGDFFSFAQGALGATQTITDFSAPQGDWIDLRMVDANEQIAGDQAFRFIGEAGFGTSGNAAGQLRFDAATQSLLGSTDADADAELVIVLVGITHLGKDAGGITALNMLL